MFGWLRDMFPLLFLRSASAARISLTFRGGLVHAKFPMLAASQYNCLASTNAGDYNCNVLKNNNYC